jgi:hypothetical protein
MKLSKVIATLITQNTKSLPSSPGSRLHCERSVALLNMCPSNKYHNTTNGSKSQDQVLEGNARGEGAGV